MQRGAGDQAGGSLGMEMGVGYAGGGGECSSSSAAAAAAAAAEGEERQLLKGEIAVHPLCEQLVAAHVGCLRVATPIDHLPLIDAQLAQSSGLLHSYAAHHRPFLSPHDKHDLDSFLVRPPATTIASYAMRLCRHTYACMSR
jgi:hypothetical protein